MALNNILKNNYTKIILGLLWGFGLACIFRCACNGRKCIIYKAPKPSDVENSVYNYDEKCYKYSTVTTECKDDAIA
jgi:hypothetical protein